LLSIIKEEEKEKYVAPRQDSIYLFMYALKSSEARRQYPRRLKMLFDFLNLPGSLEQQAEVLLDKSKQENGGQWAQHSIMPKIGEAGTLSKVSNSRSCDTIWITRVTRI